MTASRFPVPEPELDMAHSVSRHLRLEIDAYDTSIRQFIRGYEKMLDAAVDAVLDVSDLRRVVDLGSGTGALAERLLERHPSVRVELWDVDPEMLARARQRLTRFAERAIFLERSFFEPLDDVDAAMASLALHHVRERDQKLALYRRIAAGLRPGGVLVNADVTMPEDENERRETYQTWADHMVAQGIEQAQTWRHFDEWSREDRYFSCDAERSALEQAGLTVECRFSAPPSTVLVGTRPRSLPAPSSLGD